tara:strand:- start:19145 stop:19744 length:600 start_codon:yes stop_codon:yes gene_type:complete
MAGLSFSSYDYGLVNFGAHGALHYVKISDRLAYFSTGLEYVGKGEKNFSSPLDPEEKYAKKRTIEQNFLSVPFTFGIHGTTQFYYAIEGGPLFSFLVNANERRIWNDEFHQFLEITRENISDELGRFYLSGLLQFNIGYHITEQHTVQLCSRFSFGIIQTNDPNPYPWEDQDPIKRYNEISGVVSLSYAYTIEKLAFRR